MTLELLESIGQVLCKLSFSLHLSTIYLRWHRILYLGEYQNEVFFTFIWKTEKRQRKKDRYPIHWFTPQLPTIVRAVLGNNQEPGAQTCLPRVFMMTLLEVHTWTHPKAPSSSFVSFLCIIFLLLFFFVCFVFFVYLFFIFWCFLFMYLFFFSIFFCFSTSSVVLLRADNFIYKREIIMLLLAFSIIYTFNFWLLP